MLFERHQWDIDVVSGRTPTRIRAVLGEPSGLAGRVGLKGVANGTGSKCRPARSVNRAKQWRDCPTGGSHAIARPLAVPPLRAGRAGAGPLRA
jgi:hypothetical protein